MNKGSGLFVKKWNGYQWEFKELPKKNKKKFSWKFVLLLSCLVLGFLSGYLLNGLG
jgi:hypothetical protein